MRDYLYINDRSQFDIKDNTILGFSKETEDIILSTNKDVFIDISNMKNVEFIDDGAFSCSLGTRSENESSEVFEKLLEICSGLVIHDMQNLREIKEKAFKSLGSNYGKDFTFQIYNCPNLEIIKEDAFEYVAQNSQSILYNQNGCNNDYIFTFMNCPKLQTIEEQAFSEFGKNATNLYKIDLSYSIQSIGECAFADAFNNSKDLKQITFKPETKIHDKAFVNIAEKTKDVQIIIRDCELITNVHDIFTYVGEKRNFITK